MSLAREMWPAQYMHFIVMRAYFIKRGKGTVEISSYAYLFSDQEVLPPGQYNASAVSSISMTSGATAEECARASAKVFRGCRDSKASPPTTLKLVDHTPDQLVLKAVAEADEKDLVQLKQEGE